MKRFIAQTVRFIRHRIQTLEFGTPKDNDAQPSASASAGRARGLHSCVSGPAWER